MRLNKKRGVLIEQQKGNKTPDNSSLVYRASPLIVRGNGSSHPVHKAKKTNDDQWGAVLIG